jgi:hypothetical protein
MSHAESSTAGGLRGYKEPTVTKLIGEMIEEWDKLDLKDDTLWEYLHYEFEFTEEQIATVPTPISSTSGISSSTAECTSQETTT